VTERLFLEIPTFLQNPRPRAAPSAQYLFALTQDPARKAAHVAWNSFAETAVVAGPPTPESLPWQSGDGECSTPSSNWR
jgi:hypothetical protein